MSWQEPVKNVNYLLLFIGGFDDKAGSRLLFEISPPRHPGRGGGAKLARESAVRVGKGEKDLEPTENSRQVS
jgi:hypothetical protein